MLFYNFKYENRIKWILMLNYIVDKRALRRKIAPYNTVNVLLKI